MNNDTCIARLDRVGKRYGNVVALDGIDLSIHRGEVLALLGPNGAGKSTSIGLLLGLIRADSGTASLFGRDPQDIQARRRIGVMLQSASLPPTLKLRELLTVTASYYPEPRGIAECAALAGITDLMGRKYADLSGGQQRRAQFAMALAGRPEILFLDEPTVGMDVASRQSLWSSIRTLVAGGCAVVLTTHYLEEAEALADRVCVVARGKVISEGSVDALRAHVAVRRVRCVTRTDIATVSAWPGVASVELQHGRLSLATADAESVVRRLLAADEGLSELEVQRAGLAEAFAEITRESETCAMAQEAA
ncbi:ABC transporter ATP-binding protein [Xanthomonas sp. NCPPB 2632]|uniref:ABC transporter ATP-binding protein n=1 Tax=Xanthomonas sp. NCPPB 2632 TaxID=3240912 RepID=UPI00351526BF